MFADHFKELLQLGEVVGSQSRGLSQDAISSLPFSKYKCSFFWRKKSRRERCVICQMEYKRHERQITLPCKHTYHAGCGSQWLSINKVGMWVFGGMLGIDVVTAAILGLSVLLITGVVTWKECLGEDVAWDTLTWFAALISMGGYLNKYGLISWFSETVVKWSRQ